MRRLLDRILVSLVVACLAAPDLGSLPASGSEVSPPDRGSVHRAGGSFCAHRVHSRSKAINRYSRIDQDSTPDDLDDESVRICHPLAIAPPAQPRTSPHPAISSVVLGPRDASFRPAGDRSPLLRC